MPGKNPAVQLSYSMGNFLTGFWAVLFQKVSFHCQDRRGLLHVLRVYASSNAGRRRRCASPRASVSYRTTHARKCSSVPRRRRRKKRLTMTSSGVDAFQNRPLPALTAAQRYHLDVFGYVVVRTSSSCTLLISCHSSHSSGHSSTG